MAWQGIDLTPGTEFWTLLPTFVVVTLVVAVKTSGDGVVIQQVSLRRPRAIDFRVVQGTVNASGLGGVLSGLAGTPSDDRLLAVDHFPDQSDGRRVSRHRLLDRRRPHPGRILPEGHRTAARCSERRRGFAVADGDGDVARRGHAHGFQGRARSAKHAHCRDDAIGGAGRGEPERVRNAPGQPLDVDPRKRPDRRHCRDDRPDHAPRIDQPAQQKTGGDTRDIVAAENRRVSPRLRGQNRMERRVGPIDCVQPARSRC